MIHKCTLTFKMVSISRTTTATTCLCQFLLLFITKVSSYAPTIPLMVDACKDQNVEEQQEAAHRYCNCECCCVALVVAGREFPQQVVMIVTGSQGARAHNTACHIGWAFRGSAGGRICCCGLSSFSARARSRHRCCGCSTC